MHNYNNLCMNCMREIEDSAAPCPFCDFDHTTIQSAPFLPMRTIVSNRYLVGNLIEHNGDGATYMGWDIEQKTPVNIREFLPDAISMRLEDGKTLEAIDGCQTTFSDCYQSFLDLWRKLARMRGLSALILVIDIVEDNGTAYAISEHMENLTLRDYLLSSQTGYLSWQDARTLFMPVLSTLATLHSVGIIHRGISPTTLIIGKDKKMRISGFSIWQARASWSELNPQLFAGYAAIEQYGFEGQQGPWTDIYAFAAVLYRTLIGSTPLEATSRVTNDKMMVPGKFAEQLPAYVINALINALQILPEDRTRSVEEFRAELSASPTVTVNSSEYMSAHEPINAKYKEQNNQNLSKPLNEKPAKNNSALSVGLKAGLIVGGVTILIFIILWATVLKDNIGLSNDDNTKTSSQEDAQVEVPNFVNRTYSTVISERAYSTNFTFTKKEVYSDTVRKGYIISQSVDAGDDVPVGTEIELVVSLGVERIEFPNVIGMSYSEAEASLTALGFKCSKIERINSSGQPANTVAEVSLTAGETYAKGTSVVLQVWTEMYTDTPAGDF